MLRRITIILMTIACMVCSAQTTVSSYKYWVDSKFSDAKTGNVTDMEFSFDIDISDQDPGVHFFYVMPKDSDGKWGKLHRFMYYYFQPKADAEGTKIKSLEYWMDGDFENRKTESTDNTTIPLSVDIGSMTYGIHTISYRVQNDIGQYGPMKTYMYYINPAETFGSSVESFDYWIDGDYSARKTQAVTEEYVTLSDIDISTLGTGVHFFYVQPKDNLGKLGKLHRYMFFIPFTTEEQEGTSISKVEYWIDEDYNGRVSKATNETTIPIEVDIKGLGYGNHIISYRIVNDLGQYSELRRKMFYLGLVGETLSLKGYEYWIDEQYDSRVTGTVSGASAEIDISDIDISSLSEGVHFFYVRTLNDNDQYGKLHRYMFYIPKYVEDEATANMSKVEYWIDNDMANRITVPADAMTTAINFDISDLKYGLHSFSYRAMNTLGEWSTVVNKKFYVNDKDYSVVYPLVAYRYFFNERRGEEQISSTTQYSDDIILSIPSSKVVPINLNTCQFEFNTPEEGKLTMNRDVVYKFAIQFQNSNGEWNAPANNTFSQPETVEYGISELALGEAHTAKKPADGDIEAVKIVVPQSDTYYLHSVQKCSMGVYNSDGSIKFSISPTEMKAGYGEYYEAGTYYGIIYNAKKDGDNADDNITVRFNDSSIKISELLASVKENVLYISCATEDVKIYYTIDGSTPTTESSLYTTEGIKLTDNCRVQAIAVKDGMLSSDILTFDHDQFTVADPVIEVDNLKIKISTSTEGATIYYTLDESSPLTDGYKYTSPIPFTENTTVTAVAKKENFNTSDIIRETFVKNEYTCQKPAFIREGDILKLSTSDEGASIYYTLDGSDPRFSKNVIRTTSGGTITLPSGKTTAKAVALDDALFTSAVATDTERTVA